MPTLTPSMSSPSGDPFGAFCRENHVTQEGAAEGPLQGLTFAVKDVFDVRGSRTGFGHPAWLETHPPAAETAVVVTRLLDAGADLLGRTISDELCYSLSGENFHYGTPVNPRAPDRLPGGSSSGSAVAVAGELVDFAVGTDCGGSVRVPASYCGLFGIRPTHGRISLNGVSRFAPRFDTVGWFARDAAMLERVGEVLLGDAMPVRAFTRMIIAEDAFQRADENVREALEPAVQAIASRIGAPVLTVLSADGLDRWLETFRLVQAGEIWTSLGAWISRHQLVFGKGIADRFAMASKVAPDDLVVARERVEDIAAALSDLIGEGDLVCLPTTPSAAPLRGGSIEEVEIQSRGRAMELLCASGLGGLPQLTIPVGTVDGAPVGLSIMGRRGTDKALLRLASSLFADSKGLSIG